MHARQMLILCVLLGMPVSFLAQTTSPEVAKVLALEQKWTDAYKQHDLKSLTSMLAEDVAITVEDGRVFGRVGYIAHTADSSVQVELAEESDLRVRLHGNIAVVTGAYHEVGTSKGVRYEYHDRLTDVWMKVDGQWQLIASQYSVPVKG